MDLLKKDNALGLYDEEWKIYSTNQVRPAQYIGREAQVKSSLIVEGCTVNGVVENSVLFQGVTVGRNTIIRDSIIMPDAKIGDNVIINKAIIGSNAVISRECRVGNGDSIAVIASGEELECGTILEPCETA